MCESVVANGAVLLLNRNNALPLSGNEKVSLLGTSSARFVYGGTGSGGMDTSKAMTLKDALEQDGFTVNPHPVGLLSGRRGQGLRPEERRRFPE